MTIARRLTTALLGAAIVAPLLLLSSARGALAQGAPVPPPPTVSSAPPVATAAAAPASAGTTRLATDAGKGRALGVAVQGDALVAKVCKPASKTGDRCDPTGGTVIKLQSRARVLAASITPHGAVGPWRYARDRGEREVGVRVAGSRSSSASYDLQPRIVWTGFTDGPTRGTDYVVESGKGTDKISFVERVSFCGTTVVASKEVLDPRTLTLAAAPTVDPAPDAKKSATHVVATKLGAPPKMLPLLRALGASSGDASLMTDGDYTTSWIEHASGTGVGQFVSTAAPDNVATSALDIVLAPPAVEAEASARAPKTLLVVLSDRSFLVDLPEDASPAGASFTVPFPQPERTRCVGVVVTDVYPGKTKSAGDKRPTEKSDPATFVSEVSLRTRFENLTLDELVASLRGAGADGRERAELVSATGARGVAAAVRGYAQLDGVGQDLARRVIDAASCDDKLTLYVPMLASHEPVDVARAHDHVRRCGKEAGPALLAALGSAKGPERAVFAEELALLDPGVAVPALVDALAASTTVVDRRLFRKAIAKAGAARQLRAGLRDRFRLREVRLARADDQARSFARGGAKLGDTKAGSAAFATMSQAASDFASKYLLLGPAAALARNGDPSAKALLGAALSTDTDARIRVRAAELARSIRGFEKPLFVASTDKAVRVREAAVHSLSDVRLGPVEQRKLAGTLGSEPWTFVRRATAQALGAMPGDPAVDTNARLRDGPRGAGHRASRHRGHARRAQSEASTRRDQRARARWWREHRGAHRGHRFAREDLRRPLGR